jgi:uncharacterized membrane protein YjfL (UPF0719 family)
MKMFESETFKRRFLALVMAILFAASLLILFAPRYSMAASGIGLATLALWAFSLSRPEQAELWARMRTLVVLVVLLSLVSVWLVLEPSTEGSKRLIQRATWGGVAVTILLVLFRQFISLVREIVHRLKSDRAEATRSR